MLLAGVNAIRINMSHGSRKEYEAAIKRLRSIAEELKHPTSVLVDLSGPKIRTGTLKDSQPVYLESGALFTLTIRQVQGDADQVSTNYIGMPGDVHVGARLLLDDGSIELRVEEVTQTDVLSRVVNGGVLGERKGINFPGVQLAVPSLTEKDRQDLEWALQQDVDYVALSFVRRAADCEEAKKLIEAGNKKTPLVAKIEKAEAIENLDEIIAASDGVMVARGDLGVETSVELVPVYQKTIIEKATLAEKFVITATQMLQSMVSNPRPTRAESTDVANAVWDGTDALMLSNETAVGNYPVESVATMVRIIETAERGRRRDAHTREGWMGRQSGRFSRALCEAAAFAADEMNSKTIGVFTESGLMARRLSNLRPAQRIVALTPSPQVQNELALIWGIESVLHRHLGRTEELVKEGDVLFQREGIAEKGEVIVLMAGRLSGLGLSSSMKLHVVGEA